MHVSSSDPVQQLMQEPAEPTEETKHSRGFGRFVFWAGVVLAVYVLSFGPVLMMAERGEQTCIILLVTFYSPIDWVCYNTPLRQPIGMDLHLRCPEMVDHNGNPTRHRDRNDDLAVAGNLSIGQPLPNSAGVCAAQR